MSRRQIDPADPTYSPLICDPLTAYRRDLERVGDIVRFGTADERWLRNAVRLERIVSTRTFRATAVRTLAREPLLRPSRLLALTERIEAAGALVLSFNMLESARRVWDLADVHAAGAALCRQARICRTFGEVERASQYYAAAIQLAIRHRLPDVRGDALVGRGVMHGMRGDLTSAYRAFGEARRVAGRNSEVVASAFIGEMAAARAHDDWNRVISAGSLALRATPLSGPNHATLLILMASVALRAQQPRAAGGALRQALSKSRHPRLRLHIFAKLAKVAAILEHREELAEWARKFSIAATRVNLPADELSARSELAQAFAIAGETGRARRLARSVRAQALTLRLAIVVRECDEVLKRQAVAMHPVRLRRPALQAISAFEGA